MRVATQAAQVVAAAAVAAGAGAHWLRMLHELGCGLPAPTRLACARPFFSTLPFLQQQHPTAISIATK